MHTKRIGKELEFHGRFGSSCERCYAVIGENEFSDPEIAAAGNSPDRKTLLVWLDGSALLNVVLAADPLSRLRIIEQRILESGRLVAPKRPAIKTRH
jgi:hypothetical protein